MPRCRPLITLAIAFTAVAALGPARALAQNAPAQPAEIASQDVTLPGKPIVYLSGSGTWDSAYATLVEAFKTIGAYLDKEGLKPAGPAMTIYTAMDDTNFNFQAAIPLAEPPKNPPTGNLGVGTSPDGKALKFMHRGTFESTTATYEAINNLIEQKQLQTRDMFIEEYVVDLMNTPQDQLVFNIFVPLK